MFVIMDGTRLDKIKKIRAEMAEKNREYAVNKETSTAEIAQIEGKTWHCECIALVSCKWYYIM